MVEDIEAELAAANSQVTGEIRLAAFGSLASSVVPQAIASLAKEHPQLSVTILELEPADGLKAAASKKMDLAVVDDLVSAGNLAALLEFHPLCTDHFEAVVAADHKFAGKRSIQLSELAHERWALNQSAVTYHTFLLNAFHAAGFSPRVMSSCRNMAATLEMVRTGYAVSVLPQLALKTIRNDPEFSTIPIRPILNRRIFVALPKGAAQRPAVRAVLTALEAAVPPEAALTAP
ncbi:hypothetical protein CS8_024260 [Cupriavidus sp. 8B]